MAMPGDKAAVEPTGAAFGGVPNSSGGGSLRVPDIQTGLVKPYRLAGRHVDFVLDLRICNRLIAPVAGTAGALPTHSLRGSAAGRGRRPRRSLPGCL